MSPPTADEAREDVLTVVSHDLRGPLGSIQVALEALANPDLTPAQRTKYLTTIRHASERANRLLDELSDVTLMETGRFAIEARPVRPSALLMQVVQENEAVAESYGMKIEARLARAPETMRADRDRILQALAQLVRFALQHARGRGPVELYAIDRPEAVALVVRDHGPGLQPGSEEKLFDAFWAQRPRAGGAHLGMAVVKGIVDAHGGTVRASNDPEGGSRFEIELPKLSGSGGARPT